MFGFLLVFVLTLEYFNAQFFEAEAPWQFAGFAAINIPASDSNEISSFLPSYSPFQQQLQFQQLQQSRNLLSLQQQQQQQQQNQALISSPHNPTLLPDVIAIPKQISTFSAGGSTLQHATYLSLVNDKENFQASGCGWDLIRLQCHDLFGLCKGGCRDFAIAINSPIHDCRCIPFGYLALVKLAGK
ncbi:DB domain-containing protein [Caenorhabditis elegans]|uniref:DB domain-containing protein n=1 Tax=Caenorhabditis elegans TaxID=6239 RepID=A0ACB1G5U7_CAEEL